MLMANYRSEWNMKSEYCIQKLGRSVPHTSAFFVLSPDGIKSAKIPHTTPQYPTLFFGTVGYIKPLIYKALRADTPHTPHYFCEMIESIGECVCTTCNIYLARKSVKGYVGYVGYVGYSTRNPYISTNSIPYTIPHTIPYTQ